jgi:hypothetical protein
LGGHSHNDQLSFELHVDGLPLIVDPGTATYTRDPELRNALRSTRAHNVPEIDGQEQFALDASKLFSLPAPAACEVISAGPRWLIARHGAYGAAEHPVQVERHFCLNPDLGALSVIDHVRGRGRHSVALRLHVPDEQIRLRPATPDELQRAQQVEPELGAPGGMVAELGPDGGVRAVVALSASLGAQLEPAHYSPGYGELRPARVLLATAEVELPVRLGMVALFGRRGLTSDMPSLAPTPRRSTHESKQGQPGRDADGGTAADLS